MIPVTLTDLRDLTTNTHDTLIDVRAPSEFGQDHLPGAVNLPVLTDAQRAEVGTIYTQDNPFRARKIGAALVAQNTSTHLQGPLANKPGSWQPLIYCWRGGQRSGAFATILDQIGWRVRVLNGGYRSYRRLVVRMLYDTSLPHRLCLISGGTGMAKTALLQHMAQAGAQVLDLEGIACHRGSLFGAMAADQPAQKMFESTLARTLSAFDPSRITWVEAESSKIGDRLIPPSLWAAMARAPRVEMSAPLAARADYLSRAYADLTDDPARLARQISQLRPFHAAERIAHWHALADSSAWPALAAELMSAHYDPRYAKSTRTAQAPVHHWALPDLSDATLAATAQRLTAEFT